MLTRVLRSVSVAGAGVTPPTPASSLHRGVLSALAPTAPLLLLVSSVPMAPTVSTAARTTLPTTANAPSGITALTVPGSRGVITVVPKGSDEEKAFLGDISLGLGLIDTMGLDSDDKIEVAAHAVAEVFSGAWQHHAKEVIITNCSKSWWDDECNATIKRYHKTQNPADYMTFQQAMRAAKHKFFNEKIEEIASECQHLWDLMAWVKQHNLPACEAIAYNGKPCHSMDSLWEALHGMYNAASGWQCDLAILDQLNPSPEQDWLPFSRREMMDALLACSSRSAPGPDHNHMVSPQENPPDQRRKLIEKMISTRLQFDCVKHKVFHPNQFGGIQQRSTEDAGVFLTHVVCTVWAKGLKTSVITFVIAQFFPSLNHEMLLGILARQGFPVHVCWFFASYLVGRGMRYLWNLFSSSDFRPTDMNVSQGSALSPVLSALYLVLVIQLFKRRAAHVGCDILSYVDDGTLIVQCKMLEDNLPPLCEAYKIMFNLFDVFGLVMEHSKSKLFHFTCQHDDANPPIVLDFEPFTAASPLKPKTFWRYLGFYFDRTLSFREHVQYYSTKAISTIHAMRMLDNSLRGLTPKQKRILYQACIVPIATYGFHLWYNDFAKCKGHLQSLTKMQHRAALWIIGAFRMSPTGRCEALAGLIPVHLHLRKSSLMGRHDALGAHVHWWHINNLGTKAFLVTKSMAVDVAGKLPRLTEVFDTDSNKACPGNQIMDVFSNRISFHPRPNGASVDEQITLLDATLLKARGKEHSAIVACDSSVPRIVPCRLWLQPGSGLEIACIGMATAINDINHIYVFTDHLPSAEQAVDLGIQSRTVEISQGLH
ncbi:hypothetical protein NP233_g4354 [Leucocoprinus birnbaumii]|uniref:Reverse transcriptase domain-containing protein n=1 Tax=Leucocoprinus birnbaumii TaxID=56174 RepID=A0AAD5VUV5_9AGAR|nr:hypothetical protein NP233_g4354 [Leucocoprinus birnbaumii]